MTQKKKNNIKQPEIQLCKRCFGRLTVVEDSLTGNTKLWCFRCEAQLLGRN